MKKRSRGNPIPLIVENHPDNYDGYNFITLIQYRKTHYLTIIDNVTDKNFQLFVLDYCGPSKISEEAVITVAQDWWENKQEQYPVSFAFSIAGITNMTSMIYRTFNIEYVTRVIGPLVRFEMQEVQSIKRRKRKIVQPGVEVHNKFITLDNISF